MAITLDDVRSYCLGMEGKVTEDMPFGEDVLVFRIGGKIFLLANLAKVPLQVNLKCDPDLAVELREQYPSVIPGYHMNKQHWNTVILDGSVPVREVYSMIDHSYDLIRPKRPVRGGTKKAASGKKVAKRGK